MVSTTGYRCLVGMLLVSVAYSTGDNDVNNYENEEVQISDFPNRCPCVYTGPTCLEIGGCHGMRDGNYQACSCCHGYISCSGGLTYYMPCPANLVWADDKKMCNYTSRTCRECAGPYPPPPPPGRCPCVSTGYRCIKSCTGLPDGDYQSCNCCHGKQAFITCSNGLAYNMPCPAGLVWADNIKQCNYTSSTCTECTRWSPNSESLKWTNL